MLFNRSKTEKGLELAQSDGVMESECVLLNLTASRESPLHLL